MSTWSKASCLWSVACDLTVICLTSQTEAVHFCEVVHSLWTPTHRQSSGFWMNSLWLDCGFIGTKTDCSTSLVSFRTMITRVWKVKCLCRKLFTGPHSRNKTTKCRLTEPVSWLLAGCSKLVWNSSGPSLRTGPKHYFSSVPLWKAQLDSRRLTKHVNYLLKGEDLGLSEGKPKCKREF